MKVNGVSGFLLAASRSASSAEKSAAQESAAGKPERPKDPAQDDGSSKDPKAPVSEDPGYGIHGPGSGGGYIRVFGKWCPLDPEDRVDLGSEE